MASTIRFHPLAPGITDLAGNRLGSIDPHLSRTNYFDGQLLKASDLTRDQIYLDERVLEVGQAFGSGIASGLELSLQDGHRLVAQPGLALAPSGRVLQLSGRTLEADLGDLGTLATLNQGRLRRLQRGLYIVALRHTEVIAGVAEAFPADLESRRRLRISAYAEGVELGLTPSPVPLPRGDALSVRATLARTLLETNASLPLAGDDAVALGLLAVEDGRPAWLDLGLVRRSLRSSLSAQSTQTPLTEHYRELYNGVLQARRDAGLRGGFAASQYFRVLPASGPLPKDSVDPVGGTQRYFPAQYEVSVAPVRRSELATLLGECATLTAIDLEADRDVDVMVLAVLDDESFSQRARQLEFHETLPAGPGTSIRTLLRLTPLALRLFSRPPVHRIDTDSDVWKRIWTALPEGDVLYVKRPPRTAETNVSAVVLAAGFALPPAGSDIPPSAEVLTRLRKRADDATASADTAAKRAEAAEGKLVKLVATIKDLEARITVPGDTRLQDALKEIDGLKTELTTAAKRINELADAGRQANTLAIAHTALTDKISELTKQLDATKADLDRAREGNGADAQTLARIEQLTKDLSQTKTEVTDLRGKLNDAGNRTKALEENNRLLGTERDAEKAKAEGALTEAEKAKSALQGTTLERDKLRVELQIKTAEVDEVKNKLLAENEAVKKLQKDGEEVSKNLSQSLLENKDLEAKANSLDKDLGEVRKNAAELKAQLAALPKANLEFDLVAMAMNRGNRKNVAQKLEDVVGENHADRIVVVHLLGMVDRQFDKALWPSLTELAERPKALPEFLRQARTPLAKATPAPQVFTDLAQTFGFSESVVSAWKSFLS